MALGILGIFQGFKRMLTGGVCAKAAKKSEYAPWSKCSIWVLKAAGKCGSITNLAPKRRTAQIYDVNFGLAACRPQDVVPLLNHQVTTPQLGGVQAPQHFKRSVGINLSEVFGGQKGTGIHIGEVNAL